MFKSLPSVRLPKKVQGLIYYTCKTYDIQPREVQNGIKRLIYDICGKNDVGGYSQKALLQLLTTEKGIEHIAIDCYCSSRSICTWRKLFYESAAEYNIIPKRSSGPT